MKRTAISLMCEERGDLPEKIVDRMIEIVHSKEEEEKARRRQALRKRLDEMVKSAEKEIHDRYEAKVDTLEVIKIHMKKGEYDEASALLRGFYLTRKAPSRRAKAQVQESPPEVGEAVREVLMEKPASDTFEELARLMSVSEEEARMYALELASGFHKATGHEITAEKAAECYLKFRNWDFKNTWIAYYKARAS